MITETAVHRFARYTHIWPGRRMAVTSADARSISFASGWIKEITTASVIFRDHEKNAFKKGPLTA
jgi:hypothetical protein